MTLFDPKQLTLRDGARAHLAPPQESDAQRLIDYLNSVKHETGFLLHSPNDPLPDLEAEVKWVRSRREGKGITIVTKDDDGNIIACCEVGCSNSYRYGHRGDIGISILGSWCNRGLGGLLMNELVAWGRAQAQIMVLSLCVYADNARAIKVYERAGFVQDGHRRWHIQRDGQLIDEITMSLWVGDGPEPVSLS
jgi:RimJ/RimL family protein N-acetyltransferase